MAVETKIVNEEIMVVGDRVDIVVQSGQVYRALIEDRVEDGPFLVAVPSRKGMLMPVEQDDDIYMVFYRESGRYIAHMKVVALERRFDTKYMWLLQKTVAQKNQRREAYRLPVSFGVHIYEFDPEGKGVLAETTGETAAEAPDDEARAVALEQADSRDLSVTGIALITRKQYTLETNYTLVMQMEATAAGIRAARPEKPPPLELFATVKRSIPWRVTGKFNTGMHFFGVTKQTSEEIAKFVLAEQQRQIRMRRL